MSTQFNLAGGGTYYLQSSIGSTDTTIDLSSFADPTTGTPYTMTLLNTNIVYGTIAPRTSQSEFISFTGITQNADGTATLTGVTRGLQKYYPYTTNAAYQLPHAGQSTFIMSDVPQVFEEFSPLENNNTWTGINTFNVSPIVPTPLSSQTTYAASVAYVNSVAFAGAPNGSLTVKGIYQEATTAQINAGTQTGSTSADLVMNPYYFSLSNLALAAVGNNTDIAVGSGNKFVTQTGLQKQAENYAVDFSGAANTITVTLSPAPVSYAAGMTVRVNVANATTGTTTINVNSLGAKTVKKYSSGAIADLGSNDILAGQAVTFLYDGTYFILQSPNANTPSTAYSPLYTNGVATRAAGTSSGTQTITHGLGTTPKHIRITANYVDVAAAQAILYFSVGTYNGTTTATVYNGNSSSIANSNVSGTSTTNIVNVVGYNSGTCSQVATGAVSSTLITLTWTLTGNFPSNDNINLLWEAYA